MVSKVERVALNALSVSATGKRLEGKPLHPRKP
jgi:hypothetical protein